MATKDSTTARISRPRTGKPPHERLSDGLPPQDLVAERAVLGCILRDHNRLADLVRILKADHFYSAAHQKIFGAMLEMADQGVPIDALTLGESLEKNGSLLDVGGAPAILDLLDETPTSANVLHYARMVHDKSVQRNLIHASSDILRDAYACCGSADELLAEAERRIFQILDDRETGNLHGIGEVLKAAFDRISERHNRKAGTVSGISSSFLDLDERTNGWQNSELIVLAARPSMGKTALALNFVDAAAIEHGQTVLFISLEMSELELADRLLCARAEVNSHLLRKGRVGSEEMQKLVHASEQLSHAPLYIDDTPGQTMLHIAATARRLKLRQNLRMVVVDYMQLIEADDRGVSRQEQISTISRRLKNLARDLKIPIIALSQLNRGAEAREGHRPRMSDLRESGSIEQDADVVLLLHRDDAYDAQEKPGEAEVIIAKQRNGPTGEVKLTFQKDFTRFRDFHAEMAPFGSVSNF